jgi:hypothetical protein
MSCLLAGAQLVAYRHNMQGHRTIIASTTAQPSSTVKAG